MEHMKAQLAHGAVQVLVAPDAANERMERHNLHMEYWAGPPAWMTLQPPETLVCWAETLKDAVDVDPQAIQHLVELIKSSRLGYQEGTRILYHLLKDSEHGTGVPKGKGKGKDKGPGEGKGSSSSSGAWQQRGYR
jgi:hypothetical protein